MSTRLVDATEIATMLGVPTSWVRESARAGSILTIRLGRYVRFDPDDVAAWIETCKSNGRPITFRTRLGGVDVG